MPDVRATKPDPPVIAIICGDLHLSHRPPTARAGEADWYEAMERSLAQLRKLVDLHDLAPICAGDVFDRWNSPPELINFALDKLPTMYAIPGQHDLPHHNYGDIERSAYHTLVQAGKIINLGPGEVVEPMGSHDGNIRLRGFPYGHNPKDHSPSTDSEALNVAVVHRYVWKKGFGYPGAPPANQLKKKNAFIGYNTIIYGDNHKAFTADGHHIINCGTFMRRAIDEVAAPCVGLLRADGTAELLPLSIDGEDMAIGENYEEIERVLDMGAFIRELEELGGDGALDFVGAITRFLEKNEVVRQVREVVLRVLDGVTDGEAKQRKRPGT